MERWLVLRVVFNLRDSIGDTVYERRPTPLEIKKETDPI